MPHLGGPASGAAARTRQTGDPDIIQVVRRPTPLILQQVNTFAGTISTAATTVVSSGRIPADTILVAIRCFADYSMDAAAEAGWRLHFLNNPSPASTLLLPDNQLVPSVNRNDASTFFELDTPESATWHPLNLLLPGTPGHLHAAIQASSATAVRFMMQLILNLPPLGA